MGEAKPWILLVLGVLGFLLAVWVYDRVASLIASRSTAPDEALDSKSAKRIRRATSGAALGLQQVFDPGIEHVIRAEQDAESDEADPGGGGDDSGPSIELYQSDLMNALAAIPIDPEEVRRILSSAARERLDWRELYEESTQRILADCPYLAPSVPPVSRVMPRA
jgi:hypothetical protein